MIREPTTAASRVGSGRLPARPTFVVIGAMRSGTTSFHHLLASHPKVFMSAIKGPGLFLDPEEPISYPSKYTSLAQKRGYRTDDELLAAMRDGYAGQPHFGESSDSYSRHPTVGRGVPAKMLRYDPDMRIIYLLRNPIDRIVSQYRHERTKPHNPVRCSLAAFLEASDDPIHVSSYAAQIERYLQNGFAPESVHIVIFEELADQLPQVLAQLTRFLEIENPPRWGLPHLNRSAQHGFGSGALGLGKDQHRRLLSRIAPQVEALEDMLGRRITAWDLSERRWCREG
jgi:hypothetical protein